MEFRQLIRDRAKQKVLFLPHAVRQMSRPERMISTTDIRIIIEAGVIIENYPDDPRGHSCLISGMDSNNRPVHIVCSLKEDYLAIITAYIPDETEWSADFSQRKNS
jgi:hypothetical protein